MSPADFHQPGAFFSAVFLQERHHLLRSLFVIVLDRQSRFNLPTCWPPAVIVGIGSSVRWPSRQVPRSLTR
jgi:hypothetical protein